MYEDVFIIKRNHWGHIMAHIEINRTSLARIGMGYSFLIST